MREQHYKEMRAQQITHTVNRERKNKKYKHNNAHIRNKKQFKRICSTRTYFQTEDRSSISVVPICFNSSDQSDFCRTCETTSWVVEIYSLVVVALKTDVGEVCIWSRIFCCKFLHTSPVEICKHRAQGAVICYCPGTESSQSWSWSLPFCCKCWFLQSHFPRQCL